jgi:GntR family transcriptional regulator/MocR family aminotransferase
MNIHVNIYGREGLSGQIYRQLHASIVDGRLIAGERLPSTRKLAIQLGVSRKTTLDVFERLITEGYLCSYPGKGTFVAEGVVQSPANESDTSKPWTGTRSAPLSVPSTRSQWGDDTIYAYDFSTGVTDKRNFPFEQWRRCVNHALRQQARERSQYRNPAGEQELRLAIARYLAASRSVICNWHDIIVMHGAQQGIDLVARAMLKAGDVVAVEEPGYPQARASFVALGAKVVGVPVDEHGLIVDELPENARLIYVTPSHQFPLGMPMSAERRIALLKWAHERGALVIEDDYDGEYRLQPRLFASLKSLDPGGVVAYVGSFSTTVFPELRIGYVVPPAWLTPTVTAAKQTNDWHTCTLTQNALAKFMLDGYFAKHLRRMHKLYAQRHMLILSRLQGELNEWFEPIATTAGIHLTARLRVRGTEQLLTTGAVDPAVRLRGISEFYTGESPQEGIRFGYGAVGHDEIATALDRLVERLGKSR